MITQPKIGVIGGMGPYASAHFYHMLLEKSNTLYAAKENDTYPEILLDSVPVPDFISNTEKLPQATTMLVNRVASLQSDGCTVIGVVCNTGHLIYNDLLDASQGTLVSMIELVAKKAQERGLKRVGVLATATTITMGLYTHSLHAYNIECMYADEHMRVVHEKIIRDVIAGKKDDSQSALLLSLTHAFIKENRLDGVILGCTELPLVFPKEEFFPVIDCMDVLADELLRMYYTAMLY